jgi:catechol 2,3-dioxygenase-like lactoylglutathione lyase family enzyme
MDKETHIQHVAIECFSQQVADTFFTKVLGIPKVKSTVLSKELSAAIFKIDRTVQMESYDNGKARFEVFITTEPRRSSFAHIGLEIDNKSDFLARCQAQGFKPFFIQKEGKQLLFVRDFSDNLFEVLEK